jgi:hypothetical protein
MNLFVVDHAHAAKLDSIGQQCAEIRDESGRLLGYFTPAVDHSIYEGVESPISAEEMTRRIQQGGGRSLKEIMADLERRG